MSGLVKFFFPSTSAAGNATNTTSIATTTASPSTSTIKSIVNQSSVTNQNNGGATNSNQEQKEKNEYDVSLGNIHDYDTTTEASLAIDKMTPTRNTSISSSPFLSANSKSSLTSRNNRIDETDYQNGTEGMDNGTQQEQQQAREKMLKQKRKEWKHYCYADFKEYLALRFLDDGQGTEESSENNDSQSTKMKEVEKMIGRYYYDSEMEDDEIEGDEGDEEDEEVQNQNQNGTFDGSSSFHSSQIMEDSQETSIIQLETQPLLHNEPSSSSSQEHHSIREFTPPTIAGDGTETKPSNSQGSNDNVLLPSVSKSISQHNKHGTQIQKLYQSQDTNSSFYNSQKSPDDYQSYSKANNKSPSAAKSTTVMGDKNASKKKSNTNNENERRQVQNNKCKKQVYNNGILPIPHTSKATKHISKIHDIHLETTEIISIPLASIRLLWNGRQIRQVHNIDKCKSKIKTCCEHECDNCNDMIYQYEKASLEKLIFESLKKSCETYGPMHQNYKSVLSMEIMELDEITAGVYDQDGDNGDSCQNESKANAQFERNKRIRQSATAAFQPNGANDNTCTTSVATAKTTNVQKIKKRRIRVFFYNEYAVRISQLMENCKTINNSSVIDIGQQSITKSSYPYLVSLQNIPAKCIVPYYMGRSERASESLLEKDFGRLSPFCICIGGDGVAQSLDHHKVSFHSHLSEVRFLSLNPEGKKDEFMLCLQNHRFDNVPALVDQSCIMAERYALLVEKYKENQAKRKVCQVLNEIEMEGNETRMGTIGHPLPVEDDDITATSLAGTKRKRVSGKDPFYSLLNEIEDIFRKNKDNKRSKEREISVYGIILSSSIPKLTRKGDWMIQLTITDDSIGEKRHNDVQDDDDTKDSQAIPSVSITAFNTDRNILPKGLCAGDIFRGHRLLVDEWNGSIVLSSLKWSTFCIVKPKVRQNFDLSSAPMNTDNNTEHGWELSGCRKRPLNTTRVNELWKYGQKLLLNHPTINPKFRTRIENICPYTDNTSDEKYGDVIVMIARFIPFPSSLLTSNSPKGFLRVWDGTGPPVTDPLPFGVNAIPQNEPSSEAVSSIANIVDWMNSRSKHPIGDAIESTHLNPPKSLCGRVVSVVIWETNHWSLIQNSKDLFAVGKFIRLRNVKEGNMYCPESWKKGPRCLHADASTLLTPLPDRAYDVVKLLEHHNQRITQGFPYNPRSGLLPLKRKLPEELLLDQYTLTSLPQCLRQPNYHKNKTWYDLIECMVDESSDRIYPVRFQIMNSSCLPIKEESLEKHVVLDVRDKTARCAVIVPFDKTVNITDQCMITSGKGNDIDDEALKAMKNKVYESTVSCREINGTKYFLLVNKLKEYSTQCISPRRSHTV